MKQNFAAVVHVKNFLRH